MDVVLRPHSWMLKMMQNALAGAKAESPHPNVRVDQLKAMAASVTDVLDEKISAHKSANQGADKVNALFDEYGVKLK
ncbi:MAG: hypothetical protein M3442_18390 [Chloroflexota bacterium]|nr:hypothetical protein [Chloroflexota bacterium]